MMASTVEPVMMANRPLHPIPVAPSVILVLWALTGWSVAAKRKTIITDQQGCCQFERVFTGVEGALLCDPGFIMIIYETGLLDCVVPRTGESGQAGSEKMEETCCINRVTVLFVCEI